MRVKKKWIEGRKSFTVRMICQTRLKATPIQGWPPSEWCCDHTGRVIHFSEYGKPTKYGWESDRETPKSRGGLDSISILSPTRWKGK